MLMKKYDVPMHHDVNVYNASCAFSVQLQVCNPLLDDSFCLSEL